MDKLDKLQELLSKRAHLANMQFKLQSKNYQIMLVDTLCNRITYTLDGKIQEGLKIQVQKYYHDLFNNISNDINLSIKGQDV